MDDRPTYRCVHHDEPVDGCAQPCDHCGHRCDQHPMGLCLLCGCEDG